MHIIYHKLNFTENYKIHLTIVKIGDSEGIVDQGQALQKFLIYIKSSLKRTEHDKECGSKNRKKPFLIAQNSKSDAIFFR